jgi:hypothetical protein
MGFVTFVEVKNMAIILKKGWEERDKNISPQDYFIICEMVWSHLMLNIHICILQILN